MACSRRLNSALSLEDLQGIVKSLYNAFDAGESALAVFLDLSKAFDSIDRQILCQKLNYYGIQGNCLKWFKSYLGRRRQVVRFGDVLSDELSSGYGVPQGGVISAVLFIIYINVLVKCTDEVEFAIYADDTNLFTTGNCMKQNIEKINRGLASIHKWIFANKLTLNINKSKFMMFKRRQMCLPNDIVDIRIIDQTYLERVDHIKFLGVANS